MKRDRERKWKKDACKVVALLTGDDDELMKSLTNRCTASRQQTGEVQTGQRRTRERKRAKDEEINE